MKRNAIFMWAYISFIGISVLLRIFISYTLWNPIVIAITFSSMFFAIEDLFSLLYQTLKSSNDISKKFIKEMRDKRKEALLFFVKLEEIARNYKGTKYDMTELKEFSEGPQKRIQDTLEILNEYEQFNSKERGKEKKLKRCANVFAFIGFLLLFCSLILSTIIPVSALIQEFITVLSFTIILSTQQLKNIFRKKLDEENKQTQKTLEVIFEDSNGWISLKEKLEDMEKWIQENSVVTKELDELK